MEAIYLGLKVNIRHISLSLLGSPYGEGAGACTERLPMLPRSCLRQGPRSATPTPLEFGIDRTLSGPQGFRGPVFLCEMAALVAQFVRPLPKVFVFSSRMLSLGLREVIR